jgi:hypothetical protein
LKKIVAGALALAVALVGFGNVNTQTAQADPLGVVVLNESVAAFFGLTAALDTGTQASLSGATPSITSLADLDPVDLDDDKIIAGQQNAYVVVAVDDSAPVILNQKNLGAVDATHLNADGNLECSSLSGKNDPDCDPAHPDGAATRDGLVVFRINSGIVTAGTTVNMEITQGTVSISKDLHVVGVPDEISVVAIGGDVVEDGSGTCGPFNAGTLADFNNDITELDVTGLAAIVVDDDNVTLPGVTVNWTTSAAGTVALGATSSVTLAFDTGTAALNLACGRSIGEATVTASNVATGGDAESAAIVITVVGPPENIALTASPAAIPCDGVTSSVVTAEVTDADGNPVVDGRNVNFSVVALGVASPINVPTEDGIASSEVTPLSGATAGVTVVVSSGGAQASILVACDDELLTPVVPVDPTPPVVTPPTTGTGFTAQGGGFPLWTLLALAVAGVALMGGGLVTRRAGQ